jgi:hypothetical protein
MATPNRQSKPYTYRTEQEIANNTYDEQYKVETVAPLGYRTDIDSFVPLNIDASGNLNVTSTGGGGGTTSATINIGQTTSAVTATQLSSSSIAMTNGVVIQALSTNTASIYIGNSGVTTANGFELTAGSSLTISPSNINLVYVIGTNATDKVCWSVT